MKKKWIDNKALFKENEISFEDKTVSKTNQLEEKNKELINET